MLTNMEKAVLIYRRRRELADGAIIEGVAWSLPTPVEGSSHLYKYRLFYGYSGQRVIGYDNERGKGDHRHIGRRESAYEFESVEKLIADFLADVARYRGDA